MLQITLVFIGFENLEFLRNYESNRIMIKSIHHNDRTAWFSRKPLPLKRKMKIMISNEIVGDSAKNIFYSDLK